MEKPVLRPDEFSRIVADRLQHERPEARVQLLGQSFLMLFEEGHRRVLSLAAYYRRYRQAPERCDDLIDTFLQQTAQRQRKRGRTLLEVREQVLPQLLPISLVEQTRMDGRELAAIHYVGNLAISFVIDEDERYSYIHRRLMERWQVKETDLLALAVRNLQQISRNLPPPLRIGKGKRLTLVWEAFDGYDASRILLTRSLCEMAAHVEGNPIIAVPHRDYMVMFGDSDPNFVEEMMERIREESHSHRYSISDKLYTLNYGSLVLYDWMARRERVVN
ncbi:MAG: DUF1444 family protein [Bacillota bacterium]